MKPITDLQAFIGSALYGASSGDLKPLCAWLDSRRPKQRKNNTKRIKKKGRNKG
jgi:hypothetical protein